MEILSGLFTVSLIIHCSAAAQEYRITVQTKVGKFIGVSHGVLSLHNDESRSVSRFLGIPYAQPPLGDLRFSKPVPHGMMESVYDATYFRPHCIQPVNCYEYIIEKDFMQSEDCLYLNIYKPTKHGVNGKKRSVMVYIHGGSFGCGGADIYDGERLSAFNDVIVVVINYRLNVFGFLSDGSTMTGNYGLWDMNLALHWIQDNIAAFGGDKNAVTIFGNSAGGAAVLFLATQPLNKGLFKRVIAHSGSILALWSYEQNPNDAYKKIVNQNGCHRNSSLETMQCMRSVPYELLRPSFSSTYMPTIDGEFVPDAPLTLLDTNTESGTEALSFLTELDLIIGVTNADGAFGSKLWKFLSEMSNGSEYLRQFSEIRLEDACEHYRKNDLNELLNLYQFDVVDNLDVARSSIIDMGTDLMLFVPAVLMADLYRQSARERRSSGNIYFYIFTQKPDFARLPEWLSGATHFMEIPYVFGLSHSFQEKLTLDFDALYPNNISYSDILMSETLMKLWSNFAKYGNPNGETDTGSEFLPEWPQYVEGMKLYLNIAHSSEVCSLNAYPPASSVEQISKILRRTDKVCRSSSASRTHSSYWLITFTLLGFLLQFVNSLLCVVRGI